MLRKLSLVAALSGAAILAFAASAAGADESCQAFRAITPLTFDSKAGFFVGAVYATLGEEVLIGKSLANDAAPTTTCDGVSCQDSGGRWRIDFGKGDTLTIELQAAVYNIPGGFGMYHATEKVVGGTGRFEKAHGLLFEKGPEVAWLDEKGDLQAQYVGEIGGSICGVARSVAPATLEQPQRKTTLPNWVLPFQRQRLSPGMRN
jgi:hypothetical protein